MRKILVRAPQWLGDAVVSTVFIKRLKLRFDDAHLSVLSTQGLIPLYASHPNVDSVLSFDYRKGDSVLAVARRIKKERFDEAFLLPRSFRSALEVWLARVPRRIGFSGDLRRFLLTDVVAYDPHLLYAHRYLKLIQDETLRLESLTPHMPRATPRAEEEVSLLGGALTTRPQPFFGLAPASIAPARTWEPDRFAQAANRLLEKHGGTIVLFGTGQEKPVTQAIQALIRGSVVDTSGRLDLSHLGWALGLCKILLANDSGLMHVASALRVPAVVLFGASDPTFALPPWGRFVALQHPEVPCVPCLRNHCVRWGPHYKECLRAISVDEVIGAVESLIQGR